MRQSIWSLSLGRWTGVHIRLHAFFLLFAVLTVYLATLAGDPAMIWYALASLAILLVSVALHELGHCYAALHFDGNAEEIVLGPLGGLAPVNVPHDPRIHLLTALAGPLVNVMLMMSVLPLLVWARADIVGLLAPLAPRQVFSGEPWETGLKLTFWINWMLVLVNLLPAYPLDGARMLRSLIWPVVGFRRAVHLVAGVAKLTALCLCLIGWLASESTPGAIVPTWLPLALIGIFLFFSAQAEVERYERQPSSELWRDEDDAEDEHILEPAGYESSEPPEPGPIRRWLERRREQRRQQEQLREEEEEWRVDEILARVHQHGIESLSPQDRAILDRVSARYRDRLRQE